VGLAVVVVASATGGGSQELTTVMADATGPTHRRNIVFLHFWSAADGRLGLLGPTKSNPNTSYHRSPYFRSPSLRCIGSGRRCFRFGGEEMNKRERRKRRAPRRVANA
jgi:hypothetical protein